MGALNFDPIAALAEIEKRQGTPANVANPANPGSKISNFSRISRGPLAKSDFCGFPGASTAAPDAAVGGLPDGSLQNSELERWVEGIAMLRRDEPPPGFAMPRWEMLVDAGQRLLDRWGKQAVRLGWTTEDLFGVHPAAPAARYDVAGLVLFVHDGEVVTITEQTAAIRARDGNYLVYRRSAQIGAVPIWSVVPPVVRAENEGRGQPQPS